jgi:pSer/pThr/pTyr-binding forkhead associated (FHA) protein
MRAELLFRGRKGPTQTFQLKDAKSVLGRDPGVAVSIPREGISRRHAQLLFDGKEYALEDLGSTNGTFVNGQPVAKDRLRHLDVIGLGKEIELIFVLRSGEAPPAKRMGVLEAAIVGDAPNAVPEPIPVGEVTLGRSSACNIVSAQGPVSKIHCRIIRTQDHLSVEDLGSSNGTFVNGQKVMTAVLNDGDVLCLAGVDVYKVSLRLGEVAAPAHRESEPSPAPGTGRHFSAEWKTRYEWDPSELAQIAALHDQLRAEEGKKPLREGPAGAGGKRAPSAAGAAAKPAAPAAPKAVAGTPAKLAAPAPAPPAAAKPAVPAPAPPAAAKPAVPAPAPPAAAKPAVPAPAPPAPAKPAAAAPPPPRPPAPAAPKPPVAAPAPTVLQPPATPSAPAIPAPAPVKPPVVVPPAAAAKPPAPVPAAAPPKPVVARPPAVAPPPPGKPLGHIVEVRLTGPEIDVVAKETGAHGLGRSKDAQLRVDHPTVSRQHARIIVSDDRTVAYVQDCGGANGTWLNDTVLESITPIHDGDTISVGDVHLKVSIRRE